MNGIINVYKEPGYTSFDVVAKLRGILKQRKIGHTGTLDPDAEGVLVVCLGNATKLCEMLTDQDKEYTATLLLASQQIPRIPPVRCCHSRQLPVQRSRLRRLCCPF